MEDFLRKLEMLDSSRNTGTINFDSYVVVSLVQENNDSQIVRIFTPGVRKEFETKNFENKLQRIRLKNERVLESLRNIGFIFFCPQNNTYLTIAPFLLDRFKIPLSRIPNMYRGLIMAAENLETARCVVENNEIINVFRRSTEKMSQKEIYEMVLCKIKEIYPRTENVGSLITKEMTSLLLKIGEEGEYGFPALEILNSDTGKTSLTINTVWIYNNSSEILLDSIKIPFCRNQKERIQELSLEGTKSRIADFTFLIRNLERKRFLKGDFENFVENLDINASRKLKRKVCQEAEEKLFPNNLVITVPGNLFLPEVLELPNVCPGTGDTKTSKNTVLAGLKTLLACI